MRNALKYVIFHQLHSPNFGGTCGRVRDTPAGYVSRANKMKEIFDQFLIFRARSKGDTDAFGRLYDSYIKDIYRFIYFKVGSKETAQDLSSEAFLRLWKHVSSDKSVNNPRGYLFQIARHLIADHYRHEEGRRPESIDHFVTFSQESASNSSEGVLSDSGFGQRQIEADTDAALVMKRISGLKEDFRDVLILRLVHGLNFKDISVVLEKKTGNVRVIFHRAMKALKEIENKNES